MRQRLLQLPFALCLALGLATGAAAQTSAGTAARADSTMLPVWNKANGNIEAFLLLEPTGTPAAQARWQVGSTSIGSAFGLTKGDTLGLICDRSTGLANAIGNLASHCMLATLDQDSRARPARQANVGASLGNASGKIGVSAGGGRDTLPSWLSPSGRNSRVNQNTLTLYGQKNIGREATVSIGGTWARARLIPAGDISPALTDQWTTKSLVVGAGVGNFGANIVGRVVDTQNAAGQWEGLGLGLTWRTPWSGQLTVGADNVVSRGKNPFSPGSTDLDEGTVPYVRYEQDL